MRKLLVLSLTSALAWVASSYLGGQVAATPNCGENLAAPQVISAVRQLAPDPGTGWIWSSDPSTFEGNFDPCATLSTALASVEGATGSSPVAALMFHNGEYVGTATPRARGFTRLNIARTTDDTVVLDYKTPGACNACPPAAVNSVRYLWQGNRIVTLDPLPAQ